MSIAAAIRQMLDAGLTIEQALTAVEAIEANSDGKPHDSDVKRTARQERNRRYYERRKASELRLNTSNSDEQDGLRRKLDDLDATSEPPRAHVVSCLEVKKDTLPTSPTETTVPIRTAKPRKPLPEGWPADGFDQWWLVYPRRTAKGDAETAFTKAARRADTTFAALMDATRRFARSPPEPQFCPHPATWLNGKRYLDEQPDPSPSYAGRPAQADGPARRRGTMFDAAIALEARLRSGQRGGPVDAYGAADRSGTLVLDETEIRYRGGARGGF